MKSARSFLAAVVVAAASGAAFAGTVYVPADQPTIQAGVDAAQAGDTVLVAAGAYRESVTVSSRTDLTIQAAAGVTILPAATRAPGFLVTGCTRVVIDGFAVSKSRAEGIFADQCSRLTVSHCSVTSSRFDGIRVDGSTDCVVADCTVTKTGRRAVGISLSFGAGPPSDRCFVQRCYVLRSGGEGIDVHGDSIVVEDCTVTASRDDGIELDRDAPTTNSIVRRCFVNSAGGVGIICTGTGNLVEDNTVTRASFHGISLFAIAPAVTTNNTVRRNVVTGTVRFDGIEVLASGCTVDRNTVSRARRDGIYMENAQGVTAGSTATSNNVTGCGLYGFELRGTNHTVTGNTATGNRRADLFDQSTGSTLSGNTFPNVRK